MEAVFRMLQLLTPTSGGVSMCTVNTMNSNTVRPVTLLSCFLSPGHTLELNSSTWRLTVQAIPQGYWGDGCSVCNLNTALWIM